MILCSQIVNNGEYAVHVSCPEFYTTLTIPEAIILGEELKFIAQIVQRKKELEAYVSNESKSKMSV